MANNIVEKTRPFSRKMVSKKWKIRAIGLYIMYRNTKRCMCVHNAGMHMRLFEQTWPWGKLLQTSWGTLIQYGA